jgi:hypothetical protein
MRYEGATRAPIITGAVFKGEKTKSGLLKNATLRSAN